MENGLQNAHSMEIDTQNVYGVRKKLCVVICDEDSVVDINDSKCGVSVDVAEESATPTRSEQKKKKKKKKRKKI